MIEYRTPVTIENVDLLATNSALLPIRPELFARYYPKYSHFGSFFADFDRVHSAIFRHVSSVLL
jgi:hypothetical protein